MLKRLSKGGGEGGEDVAVEDVEAAHPVQHGGDFIVAEGEEAAGYKVNLDRTEAVGYEGYGVGEVGVVEPFPLVVNLPQQPSHRIIKLLDRPRSLIFVGLDPTAGC